MMKALHSRPTAHLSERRTGHFVRDASDRAGVSLAELLVVLVVIGAMLALGIQPMTRFFDQVAVHGAMAEMASLFAGARQEAIESRSAIVVRIDSVSGTLRVTTGFANVLERHVGTAYGVHLAATRDSMAYDARGLGLGASNLSIVVRRGRLADTLYLSRLGRVRW